MPQTFSRRDFLVAGGGVGAAALAQVSGSPLSAATNDTPWRYCLNTATIREQKVGIVREVDLTAEAGYDAIEPWMDTLHHYVEQGGSLPDLKKRIADRGLTVESAIGFANWIGEDDAGRKQGLEQARRDMDLLAQIGGKRIAAPPIGAHDKPGPDLPTAAARYRALLDIGASIGIVPQVELWGFSRTLNRLSETVYVAVESGHPQACVLPDIYHLHKGGSRFDVVKLLSGIAVQVFHLNDYPADPPRESISDAHRVYPGDGVAPLPALMKDLRQAGFRGVLSLELFNREYWKQDPLLVAKTGLEKMRRVAAL
ncbi:MAG: sugar phosphate isomerase/epimerase family protein [Planctomycetales bacterium]